MRKIFQSLAAFSAAVALTSGTAHAEGYTAEEQKLIDRFECLVENQHANSRQIDACVKEKAEEAGVTAQNKAIIEGQMAIINQSGADSSPFVTHDKSAGQPFRKGPTR